MCGIVGYIGSKNAQNILSGGLRRLEYRGYDSAGIVTLDSAGAPRLIRAKGKVQELGAKLNDALTDDTVGIGHTRWATHGIPSERNAHPHQAGDVYLVHNGIIENYRDLKTALTDKGHEFTSDTDSEVLAALINSYYQQQAAPDILTAVKEALVSCVGTYGIAVISAKEPERVIVARQGSPLVIGLGDGEVFIASDTAALVGHVENIIYLNDGEIAECTRQGTQLYDIATQPLTPTIEKLELDLQTIQKKGYDHFLLKEIMEQPDTLRSTLNGRLQVEQGSAKLGGITLSPNELRDIKNIIIVGCGTAYYAGMCAHYLMEQLCDDVTFQVEVASELRYRSFHVPEGSIALIVSQSGETADTLACLRELQKRGVKCFGIINAVGSTIAREVDGGVYVHVGPEISVASTKAFTSQVSAMLLFGIVIAQAKGSSPQLIAEYVSELAALPDEIDGILKAQHTLLQKLAQGYTNKEHAIYLGRDNLFPIALEGALKLKEISYIHAEGYAAGELKHGPIALVDERFFEIFLVMDNWLFNKSLSNLAEIQARGGNVIVITDSEKDIQAPHVIRLSTNLKLLSPLLFNVCLQLLAYYLAVTRGNDVDQPRNLAKSVTVE